MRKLYKNPIAPPRKTVTTYNIVVLKTTRKGINNKEAMKLPRIITTKAVQKTIREKKTSLFSLRSKTTSAWRTSWSDQPFCCSCTFFWEEIFIFWRHSPNLKIQLLF